MTTTKTIFTLSLTAILGAFTYFLREPVKTLKKKVKKILPADQQEDRELFI